MSGKGWVLVAACALTGCSSVRMVQRDSCWVKQTEKWPNRVYEEMGPCARELPAWSEDRLTRLVQECVAEADHQWMGLALVAWNRGEPMPERATEDRILKACYSDAAGMVVTENEGLKVRLGEMQTDRDHLRSSNDVLTEYLRTSNGELTSALGDAAQKPAGSAVATATARGDGNSTSDTNTNTKTDTKTESSHSSTQAQDKKSAPAAPPKVPLRKPAMAHPPCPVNGGDEAKAAQDQQDKAPRVLKTTDPSPVDCAPVTSPSEENKDADADAASDKDAPPEPVAP